MPNPSYTNQSETLHNYFRRHGLEGEASFQALAFHYVVSRNHSLNVPGAVTQRWQKAHEKINHDGLVSGLLNDIVRQDPDGANLPEWYQFFVGRKFREGSGKFFTPRPVAAAMTRLLPRRDQAVIMDPTCGGVRSSSKRQESGTTESVRWLPMMSRIHWSSWQSSA